MDIFYSKSNNSLLIILFIIVVGIFSFIGFMKEKSFFENVSAQELVKLRL